MLMSWQQTGGLAKRARKGSNTPSRKTKLSIVVPTRTASDFVQTTSVRGKGAITGTQTVQHQLLWCNPAHGKYPGLAVHAEFTRLHGSYEMRGSRTSGRQSNSRRGTSAMQRIFSSAQISQGECQARALGSTRLHRC
jgi:hypothetical protein